VVGIEIKLKQPSHSISLTKRDIEILVCLYGGTMRDLAKRVPCSHENLSRVLNGRVDYPLIRKALANELSRMVTEIKLRRRVGQLIKVA
jgi:hypothetical protein